MSGDGSGEPAPYEALVLAEALAMGRARGTSRQLGVPGALPGCTGRWPGHVSGRWLSHSPGRWLSHIPGQRTSHLPRRGRPGDDGPLDRKPRTGGRRRVEGLERSRITADQHHGRDRIGTRCLGGARQYVVRVVLRNRVERVDDISVGGQPPAESLVDERVFTAARQDEQGAARRDTGGRLPAAAVDRAATAGLNRSVIGGFRAGRGRVRRMRRAARTSRPATRPARQPRWPCGGRVPGGRAGSAPARTRWRRPAGRNHG